MRIRLRGMRSMRQETRSAYAPLSLSDMWRPFEPGINELFPLRCFAAPGSISQKELVQHRGEGLMVLGCASVSRHTLRVIRENTPSDCSLSRLDAPSFRRRASAWWHRALDCIVD